MAVKEIHARRIRAQPVFMAQQVMHFVGKDQLFKLDIALAQLALGK